MCAEIAVRTPTSVLVRRARIVRPGGPCTCAPGRYVRYAIPKVPGLPSSIISCQAVGEAARASIREHDIPSDAHLEIYIAGL